MKDYAEFHLLSTHLWFETDSEGVISCVSEEAAPDYLRAGQSVYGLFPLSARRLRASFSKLESDTHAIVSLPLLREESLMLVRLKKMCEGLRFEVQSMLSVNQIGARKAEQRQIRSCLSAVDSGLTALAEGMPAAVYSQHMAKGILNRSQLLMRHCMNMERYDRLLYDEPEKRKAIDLCTFLKQMVSVLRQDARCGKLEILTPNGSVFVNAGYRELEEMFLNVISNGLMFSPADGRLSLRLEAREGFAYLHISDEGNGLPDGDVLRAIQPYQSKSSDAENQPVGLGLGLTNAYLSCHDLGGTLLISTKENYGTSVLFQLPLAKEPSESRRMVSSEDFFDRERMEGHFSRLSCFLAPVGPEPRGEIYY